MRICASIPADHALSIGPEELPHRAAMADLVELRLDALPEFPLDWIPRIGRPVIATCRPKWEGGAFGGSEEERLGLLRRAAEAGAAWVDLEWKANQQSGFVGAQPRSFRPASVLTSYHVLDGVPPDVEGVLREMTLAGGDAIKLVAHARTTAEAVSFASMVRLALGARDARMPPVCAFAMGEAGQWTRATLAQLGTPWVYGALDRSRPTAPGQPTVEEWRDVLRIQRLRPSTVFYGILGNPVSQSLSPLLHNRAFELAGLDAIYLPVLVDDAAALPAVLSLDFRGFSVTVPHKEAVSALLERRSRAAVEVGAVNTLVRREDGWEGGNTDAMGALSALAKGMGAEPTGQFLAGKKALILGAGGAARAVAWGLARAGARVAISGRTGPRAESLARSMRLVAAPWDARTRETPDILVNATPLGMVPKVDETPYPASAIRPGMVVFDTVYRPRVTRLLRDAQSAGACTVEGVEMFLAQGALQFEAWTGNALPSAAADAVREVLK